eukprot:364968-Chlamydomonas_euryale.AAC.2
MCCQTLPPCVFVYPSSPRPTRCVLSFHTPCSFAFHSSLSPYRSIVPPQSPPRLHGDAARVGARRLGITLLAPPHTLPDALAPTLSTPGAMQAHANAIVSPPARGHPCSVRPHAANPARARTRRRTIPDAAARRRLSPPGVSRYPGRIARERERFGTTCGRRLAARLKRPPPSAPVAAAGPQRGNLCDPIEESSFRSHTLPGRPAAHPSLSPAHLRVSRFLQRAAAEMGLSREEVKEKKLQVNLAFYGGFHRHP